jgi:hypothetical protein
LITITKKKAKENQSLIDGSLTPMFGGFYLKDDGASSPSILDQTSNNFTPTSGDNGEKYMPTEEVIKGTMEASESQKEPSLTATTNFTETTIIENTTTTIETKIYGAGSQ